MLFRRVVRRTHATAHMAVTTAAVGPAYVAIYTHLSRPSEAGAAGEAGVLPTVGVPASQSALPSVHAP